MTWRAFKAKKILFDIKITFIYIKEVKRKSVKELFVYRVSIKCLSTSLTSHNYIYIENDSENNVEKSETRCFLNLRGILV